MTRVATTEIQGLMPLLDRKRVETPFVVNGQNFYVNKDGPISGFAKTDVLAEAFEDPKYVQSIRVGTESFIFTRTAIVQFDDATETFVPVYTYPALTALAPWSKALVGGLYYFARTGVDLLQYNPTTGIWTTLSGGSYPVNPAAVTLAAGRLVVASPGLISWSSIDDGADMAPSTATGAGAQSLAILGGGAPYAVHQTPDGFITFTASGILKSEAVNTINPFRHYGLSTTHIAINAYCIVDMLTNAHEHVMLTPTGFYKTSGQRPQEWEPLMSEYFHNVVLPTLDLSIEGIIRLSYSEDRLWFIASISDTFQTGSFPKAFVLDTRSSSQWGSFDQNHVGFVDVAFQSGEDVGFNYGFVAADGAVYRFTDGSADILFPTLMWNHYQYIGRPEYPARYEGTLIKFPTFMPLRHRDESDLTRIGLYDVNATFSESIAPVVQLADDVTGIGVTTPYVMTHDIVASHGLREVYSAIVEGESATLDAFIEVGPYRVTSPENIDELSVVNMVSIGMLGGSIDDLFEDWLLGYPVTVAEDWNSLSGVEDWGYAAGFSTNADMSIRGTLDGYETWEEQDNVLTEFVQSGRTRMYDVMNNGLYHLVKFDATAVEKSFALKTLELNHIPSGRV